MGKNEAHDQHADFHTFYCILQSSLFFIFSQYKPFAYIVILKGQYTAALCRNCC